MFYLRVSACSVALSFLLVLASLLSVCATPVPQPPPKGTNARPSSATGHGRSSTQAGLCSRQGALGTCRMRLPWAHGTPSKDCCAANVTSSRQSQPLTASGRKLSSTYARCRS